MSVNELQVIENQVKLMQQYEEESANFKAKADEIKESIKAKMTEAGMDEVRTPNFVIRFVQVLSSRFDTKRFKDEMGDEVYNYYTKQVGSFRFTVSQ